jgi:mycothiol maleylpyruvate isomerase-like protein
MEHPDVRGVLPRERAAFLELLTDLDDSEWEAPTECPAWTVKGIALHVLGDDLSLLSRQSYAEDQWVHANQFLGPTLIVDLLRITGDWTARSNGQSGGRDYVERWMRHQQIRRAVNREDLGQEFLVPALDVIVHCLAARLPDLGGGPGATIALTVPCVGSWTLQREEAAWSVCRGDHAEAHAELRLEPQLATPVFSRGLSGTDVGAAFGVTGDAALGFAALATLTRLIGG